ncbi:MAG: recombination mediator RecR [Culicoidibacterales bacterium]
MQYPKPLQDVIDSLQYLPGIGLKTAERLAFFILTDMRSERVNQLSQSLLLVKQSIRTCTECGNFSENDICEICSDVSRDRTQICVVESPKDIYFLERVGMFRGIYHVLNGLISPVNGIGPDDISLPELLNRLQQGNEITEVVLALSATMEGETTAKYISTVMQDVPIKMTRLAHGIPVGGDLGYADEMTIMKAFMNRQTLG